MKIITLLLPAIVGLFLSSCAGTRCASCCASATGAIKSCCAAAAAKGIPCKVCAAGMKADPKSGTKHDMKSM